MPQRIKRFPTPAPPYRWRYHCLLRSHSLFNEGVPTAYFTSPLEGVLHPGDPRDGLEEPSFRSLSRHQLRGRLTRQLH